jgi:two-component system sensor histidine kinase/response regulator
MPASTLLLARDGTRRSISDSCALIQSAAGENLGTVLVFRDVTEEHAHREELLESEMRMRAITECARDAIIMMNPEGCICYWNPAAERILGFAKEEVFGKNLHAVVAPERYHEAYAPRFEEFRKTGHGPAMNTTRELRALHKKGHEISVELSLSAFRVRESWHTVGILRDITARKRAEQELLSTNRHLETATARANEMAVVAELESAAKSQFLANMSHEIRTPMNGVLGMVGLLLETPLTEDQRRYAQTARASGVALLDLINDILDFSKIEAHKLELEELDFNLHDLMEDVSEMMSLRAYEKRIALGFIVPAAVPAWLHGDPGRLRQILINLTGNAIKFTSQGEVAVRVGVVSENSEGVRLQFTVRDTGIGIPGEKLGRLFQKFTQVDSSTTRHFGGTGLGLAISKELAQMMGGEIGVRSEPGQGSEFWFTVVLGRAPTKEAARLAVPAELVGIRVLIADSHPLHRECLTALLTSWGIRSEEVVDGPSALRALITAKSAHDPFKLAIVDTGIPPEDGLALGRTIQRESKWKETRLMLCSSPEQVGRDAAWAEAGYVAVVNKPLRRAALLRGIERALLGKKEEVKPEVKSPTLSEELGQARILVAEDNATNQKVARGILAKLGFAAEVVGNGVEAVRALSSTPFDLVLMDVQMPEMDGLQATRCIRARDSKVLNREIPIIALTAHAAQRDQLQCREAGMSDYLTKPIEVPTLIQVLRKWIKPATSPEPSQSKGRSNLEQNDALPEKANLPVFDRADLLTRLMGDEELAQTIIEGFGSDLPEQIGRLRIALAGEDPLLVGQQSHKIKGSCATAGAKALSSVLESMERAALAGNLAGARALVSSLESELGRLIEVLAKEKPPESDR